MPLLPSSRAAEQFADLIDGCSTAASPELQELVDLVRRLSTIPAPAAPAALRDRGLWDSGLRPPAARGAASPGARSTVPQPPGSRRVTVREAQGRTVVPLLPRAPAFLRLAAAVMVTVLALAGIAFGSARAMPGGALYGLKRGIEDVNVSLAANDVARDRAKLDAAKARMSELQQLRHEGRLGAALTPQTAHRVAGLLQDWADSAVSGATDLLHRPDPGARLELNHFVSQQSALLAALRPLLPAADLQRLSGGAAAFLGQLQPAVVPAAPASPGRLPRSAPIPLRPASTRPPTRQVAGAAASARGVASAGSHASSLPVPAPAGTYAGGQRAAHTAPTDAAPPVTVPPLAAPTNAAPPVAVPPGTTPPATAPPLAAASAPSPRATPSGTAPAITHPDPPAKQDAPGPRREPIG